jgi:hypothetical protein
MCNSLARKPTRLERQLAALDPLLLEQIANVAARVIRLRNRQERPSTYMGQGGRLYLLKRYSCCHHLGDPTGKFPRSHCDHSRTVTHAAAEAGLLSHIQDIRTAVRVLKTGADIQTFLAQYHSNNARAALASLINVSN